MPHSNRKRRDQPTFRRYCNFEYLLLTEGKSVRIPEMVEITLSRRCQISNLFRVITFEYYGEFFIILLFLFII